MSNCNCPQLQLGLQHFQSLSQDVQLTAPKLRGHILLWAADLDQFQAAGDRGLHQFPNSTASWCWHRKSQLAGVSYEGDDALQGAAQGPVSLQSSAALNCTAQTRHGIQGGGNATCV